MTGVTQFEPTPGGLALRQAILLYEAESAHDRQRLDAQAFASIHPVGHDAGGAPEIGAGAPLTRAHLRRWAAALGKTTAPEILPPEVLVAHSDMLAWWAREQVRPAYFALSSPPKDLKALAERTTVAVPYPAHLFVATHKGLAVFALRESRRPAPDTELLYSPVLNVFANGQLCWGSVAKPKTLAAGAIADYERAVFDSWSTHPNPGQERAVRGKGGLVRLWDDLAARGARRFPAGRLQPFRAGKPAAPLTLAQLVARGGR